MLVFLGQPLTRFGNACCARFSLLVILCTALSIHWVASWLENFKGFKLISHSVHGVTCIYLNVCGNVGKHTMVHFFVLGYPAMHHHCDQPTKFHHDPQVEQPATSKLIDMPYIRMLVDSMYLIQHVRYKRL